MTELVSHNNLMTINSIGQFTDMHLSGTDTQFIHRENDSNTTSNSKSDVQGDYTLIFTPSNPDYYWGNYIIFSAKHFPMTAQNLEDSATRLEICKTIFQKEFNTLYATHVANKPNSKTTKPKHIAITWDVPEKSSQTPIADNEKVLDYSHFTELKVFEFIGTMAMPESYEDKGYEFRSIVSTDNKKSSGDWQQVVRSKIALQGGLKNQELQAVIEKRYDCYRQQIEQQKGMWFGVFDCNNSKGQDDSNGGDKLIASLGVFILKKEGRLIARFQDVDTHPDYQRQGLCRNLIRYAVKQMQQRFEHTEHNLPFYIMAAAGSDAERVYRAVGFTEVERIFAYES